MYLSIRAVFVSCMVWGCLLPGLLQAESLFTCPSLASVKQLKNIWPHGSWLPLDVETGELISEAAIKKFSEIVVAFVKAEWSGDFLEMGHCSYGGDDHVVLARDMLKPNISQQSQWHFVTPKLLRCLSVNEDDCSYGGIGRQSL